MAVWLIIFTIIIITIFFLYCPRSAPRCEVFFGCKGHSGLFLQVSFPLRVSPQHGLPLAFSHTAQTLAIQRARQAGSPRQADSPQLMPL